MMEKEITIQYEVNNRNETVCISYNIALDADIQTISCLVNRGGYTTPAWLQLRRFELKSVLSPEGYTPLFTDNDNIKNRNAALFIDKAYKDIMAHEKFKMAVY